MTLTTGDMTTTTQEMTSTTTVLTSTTEKPTGHCQFQLLQTKNFQFMRFVEMHLQILSNSYKKPVVSISNCSALYKNFLSPGPT